MERSKSHLSFPQLRTSDIYFIAVYIALQLAADVAAVKIAEVWGFIIPAGMFIFAVTFTWRDILHERLGKRNTVNVIWAGALANVILAAYLYFAATLKPAVFWPLDDGFRALMTAVPRITIASIVAELMSELIDTAIYEVGLNLQWKVGSRVFLSNLVGVVIDSAVFAGLAFAGTMPMVALWGVIRATTIFKLGVTVISIPLISLRRAK